MPGWKRDVGRRLDALIVRTVPGWFLNFHCFTKYVKVAFSQGRHRERSV
jgi:hypothetical protein